MPERRTYSQLAAPEKCLVNALAEKAISQSNGWHVINPDPDLLRELMLALYGPERIKQEIATNYRQLLVECPNAVIAHGPLPSTGARPNPELRAR